MLRLFWPKRTWRTKQSGIGVKIIVAKGKGKQFVWRYGKCGKPDHNTQTY